MSEEQSVTHKTVGFSFNVSIEREVRVETGAKYPDKTVVKASMGGNAETMAEATDNLKKATELVREQTKEVKE
ncbi:hypothetical protein ES703_02146 [subsurface metagenome]